MGRIFCLIILWVLPSAYAQANTASKVFHSASKSTVMVSAINAVGVPFAYGTGVVLPDGSIATNCHVLRKAPMLSVRYQGIDYGAERKYADRDRDLCTITVNGLKAPAVKLGSSNRLKVGARVYAIGTPQGLELTLSEGIVSGFRQDDVGRYIQTTAPISQGSSGGGLFDEKGRLVGITSFYIAKGQNLNFALPVEWIAELPQRHEILRERDARIDRCRIFFNNPKRHPVVEHWERRDSYRSLPDDTKKLVLTRFFRQDVASVLFDSLSHDDQLRVINNFINVHIPDPEWQCW